MTTTTADPRLLDLISAERAFFHGEDEPDDENALYVLRRQIAQYPCSGMADIVAKAQWAEQLWADTGDTLDEAIAAEGYDDLTMGLVIVRDLLALLDGRQPALPALAAMPAATAAVN
jgi:hypothetical protein